MCYRRALERYKIKFVWAKISTNVFAGKKI